MIYLKGATAYEYQIGKWYLRIVYLSGGYYTWWAFWRRFSIRKEQS